MFDLERIGPRLERRKAESSGLISRDSASCFVLIIDQSYRGTATIAPLGSVTEPEIEPVIDCANAAELSSATTSKVIAKIEQREAKLNM